VAAAVSSSVLGVDHTMLQGEAVPDFDKYAHPLLVDLLRGAGLAHGGYGWKVFLRDCHRYCGRVPRPRHNIIRGGVDNKARGQIEFKVSPTDSLFCYEVTLVPANRDNWQEMTKRLRNAMTDLTLKWQKDASSPLLPAAKSADPTPPEPTVPKTAQDLLNSDLTALEGLQSNLSKILEIRRDREAAAEMRAEVTAKFEAARATALPLLQEVDRTAKVVAETAARLERNEAELKLVREKFQRLTADLADDIDNLARARRAAEAAELAAQAPAKAYDDAKAEFEAAERMELDRVKMLESVPGLTELIASLEILNKSKKG